MKKIELLAPTSTQNYTKDIESNPFNEPSKDMEVSKSQEQLMLQSLRNTIGDNRASETRLQCASQWILEKIIKRKEYNFANKKAYEEVCVKSLRRKANLITSHCFLQIRTDRGSDKLKLKWRLRPQGNKDKNKDDIGKDFETAQFAVTRALLSAAAIVGLRLSTMDISRAYLQVGKLK